MEGGQNGESPYFPCFPPLEQLPAALCRLQKPRSMLQCSFAISKAIMSNSDSIGSAPQLKKTCCRLQGVGVGCKAR